MLMVSPVTRLWAGSANATAYARVTSAVKFDLRLAKCAKQVCNGAAGIEVAGVGLNQMCRGA